MEDEMQKNRLSIITPTYNRAYILNRLYESLVKQININFEWIIVDDGSKDDTKVLVETWKRITSEFNITYLKQNNGGKHRALNLGIKSAQYDYIYIIDSDDYLVENAVEKMYTWIESIDTDNKFAGVAGLRGNKNKEIIGQFPTEAEFIDSTNLDRKKNKLLGDKAEVYKREILLKYPFPEFENEKFLSEVAVWNKIAEDGYLIRWYREIICICEYLDDGLTNNNGITNLLNNFDGYTYVQKNIIQHSRKIEKFFHIGRYIYVAYRKGIKKDQVIKNININNKLYYLGLPFYGASVIRERLRQ